jgi:type IV secretory pathway VirJ component
VKVHTRTKTNNTHYRLMLTYLDQLIENPQPNRGTSAAQALHQIADSIHRRSLVIIFSDMFEQTEDAEHLFSALQHLKHNKHEVVLFHVVDKSKELDFEFENRPYLFIDMESGERLRLQPNQVKANYLEQMGKFVEELKIKCLQYQIDFVEADINKGFRGILQSYLVKRSKMGV